MPSRHLIAAAALAAATPAATTQAHAQSCEGVHAPGTVRLVVTATGVRSAAGEVAITVYPDDKARFLSKGGKLLRARVPSVAGATSACFWLRPGYYAVADYHDENGDHNFNRTLFAIKEGFGFSNDAPTTLGLPSFASTRFPVGPNGGTIRIRMRYQR